MRFIATAIACGAVLVACQSMGGDAPLPVLTPEQISAIPKDKLVDDPVLSKASVTVETKNRLPLDKDVLNRGRQIYMTTCAACHSETGSPGPAIAMKPTAPHFNEAVWSRARQDGELFLTIQQGRPTRGMPTWKHISARDTWSIIHFLRSLSGTEKEFAEASRSVAPVPTPSGP